VNQLTNKELIEYWIFSSDDDNAAMISLYASGNYTWSLFIGHIVIEKLLKALYAQNNSGHPYAPKIHNLLKLAKDSNIELNEDRSEKVSVINTFNISARYDDYNKDFYNKCTPEYTKMQIDNIGEIRKWLKEQLMPTS
jgi:HEPN domain-containing protein